MLMNPFPRNGAAASPVKVSAPPVYRQLFHREDEPGRAIVEAFIRRVYAERYGADLQSFAPVLVSLCDDDGIVAAAGYRAATHGSLFLERYLDGPVESLLAAQANTPPTRDGIVEVGHLAAARAGDGRRLIRVLAQHLDSLGFQWVVSTLTKEMRHLFIRIGITPLALGAANPLALGADADRWGSYYEHCPLVLAAHLQHAVMQLTRRQQSLEFPA